MENAIEGLMETQELKPSTKRGFQCLSSCKNKGRLWATLDILEVCPWLSSFLLWGSARARDILASTAGQNNNEAAGFRGGRGDGGNPCTLATRCRALIALWGLSLCEYINWGRDGARGKGEKRRKEGSTNYHSRRDISRLLAEFAFRLLLIKPSHSASRIASQSQLPQTTRCYYLLSSSTLTSF